jgi:hypothetical protein
VLPSDVVGYVWYPVSGDTGGVEKCSSDRSLHFNCGKNISHILYSYASIGHEGIINTASLFTADGSVHDEGWASTGKANASVLQSHRNMSAERDFPEAAIHS